MEPANGCRICIGSLSGSVRDSLVWSRGGLGGFLEENQPGLPPSHILYLKSERRDTQDRQVTPVRPRVVHAAHRRSLTISAVLPEPNLRTLAPDAGKYRGALLWGSWRS